MQGDFTLNPLHYRHRVSRVLAQQGRVQLDSDWNEQTESFLHFLRGLAVDVIGHHGGVNDSFKIAVDTQAGTATIGWGEYYVDGIRCENLPHADLLSVFAGLIATPPVALPFKDGLEFAKQPDDVQPDKNPLGGPKPLLFYLDVFERHISSAEDDAIREVALMGPDTTSRAVVVWRVRVMPAGPVVDTVRKFTALNQSADAQGAGTGLPNEYDPWYVALNLYFRGNIALRAQAIESQATDPCTIAPDARYRGAANRLFRVEIHTPGDPTTTPPVKATFKWSEDNGSIVYPIRIVDGATVHLDSLGRDDRTQICINDWVEFVDDQIVLTGDVQQLQPLSQVTDIRTSDMTVTLSPPPPVRTYPNTLHPILRRWAGKETSITEATDMTPNWVELTNGVQVQFSVLQPQPATQPKYQTGDYWLIPARTATGDVIWPGGTNGPHAVRPHGVQHHYAPLANWDSDTPVDRRWTFAPLAQPVQLRIINPLPFNPAPVNPAPVNAAPINAAPINAAPVNAAPINAAPVSAAPINAAPVSPAPVNAAPANPAPVASSKGTEGKSRPTAQKKPRP